MANKQVRLSEAVDDFLRYRRSSDIAPGTVNGDRTVLMKFLSTNGNVFVPQINESHVVRHFEEAARTRRPATLANDHVTLNVFFDWCRHTRRMAVETDPMYGRRKPKRIVRERDRVHVSRFPALLDAAEERDPRDRVAIALLIYTLARDSEITNIRLRDVDLDAGYLRIFVQKSRIEDRMPICAELDAEIRRWLTTYAEQVGYLDPNYYLVPTRRVHSLNGPDGRLRVEGLTYLPESKVTELGRLTKYGLERIGFATKDADGKNCGEGAHTLRRSGARALFDRLATSGYDGALRIVQSMLHHSSAAAQRAVGHRHRAPRGAVEPSGGERPPPSCCRSSTVKLRAA